MVNHTSGSLAAAAAAAMANDTLFDTALPPLPSYSLEPTGDVFSWISDFWLSLLLPVAVYWAMSLFFHAIDVLDLFPQYRLHTPDEILKRNHATRYEVARDVLIQQVIQVVTGAALAITEPPEMKGKSDYDVAVWATRLRLAQRAVPGLLSALGLNATALSKSLSVSHPLLAGALAGGYYPSRPPPSLLRRAFAPWGAGRSQAHLPRARPGVAVLRRRLHPGYVAVLPPPVDAHEPLAVHPLTRLLAATFHSRHHRLYVPYAYGALYNHPLEGFLLDTLGAGIGFKVTGMTVRQGTCFFAFSTIKTVDDHCGYSFPWDPLQLITSNNAAYHDIHHQTWGIKTNFSQPFFTFWDGLLNTKYKGSRSNRVEDKKREAKSK
ncbi:hypothetical protein ACCO45_000652 [Purpureocillium lilacinum]|uniref:Uncharacterized protein n=1 Tax=Purpureocillium lilacinum TaxID=33203 RepID=A0ACC4E610_PURLI